MFILVENTVKRENNIDKRTNGDYTEFAKNKHVYERNDQKFCMEAGTLIDERILL